MWKVIVLIVGVVTAAPTNEENLNFVPLNEFALTLLDNAYGAQSLLGRKNIAISPLSVWSVFSLLAEGSSGETFHELMKGLRLPRDLRATQALHFGARSILKRNNNDVTLNGKSAIFSECSLVIHPEFCQAALGYNTDIYSVDPSNTTKLANDINYYVCIATEGQIFNAVKPEFLENLKMIIVDAVYFKANWTVPFNPSQTKEESFYSSQGKSIGLVNMMYHKTHHRFADVDEIGAQVLEMAYGRDEQFSMLILLPSDGIPIKSLLSNLVSQPMSWIDALKDSGNVNIDCYIPRFKISCQTDLVPPMQYSGILSIFDKQKAQLPGVSDVPLFVSKTIQNVEIDVNESGTVAASSTVVGLENRVLGQRFEANKEFVFMIVEKKNNVILFAGVYEDPSPV
ncbi:serine protease inhibitor 77Ba-like [Plodia interpunctella]|uniref:serine protease inhibitor 77Ba-like n=1 Tax=Plodia interpunctella TaxID=58824 RepID=UPI002367C160|nr:serine protease inhibitor 77Ba-like [Plodia interpunctella]